MRYYINYHTGTGNEWANTLEEAKILADNEASYTQKDIIIEDEFGNEVLRRPWWGTQYSGENEEEENPILFGSFGYYGDWQ